MRFKKFTQTPATPKEFVKFAFMVIRQEPKLKYSDALCYRVDRIKGQVLFECAYGFFWANTERRVSAQFFLSIDEAFENKII